MTQCQNPVQTQDMLFTDAITPNDLKTVCQQRPVKFMRASTCRDSNLQDHCSRSAQTPSYAPTAAYVEISSELKERFGCKDLDDEIPCTINGVTQYDEKTDLSSKATFARELGTERLNMNKTVAANYPLEIQAEVQLPNGSNGTIKKYLFEKLGQGAVPKATLEQDPNMSKPKYTVYPLPSPNGNPYISADLTTPPARDLGGVSASERALLAENRLTEPILFKANMGAVEKLTLPN